MFARGKKKVSEIFEEVKKRNHKKEAEVKSVPAPHSMFDIRCKIFD